MVNSEKHRRQAGCTVIVTMMLFVVIVTMLLFVVISNVACHSRQSNNSVQQDDPGRLSLTQFFFVIRFNKQLRKHAPTSYLLQRIPCRAIDNNTKNTVKGQQLFTDPMQIENNTMQNTTITSPTIQESENEKKSIKNLAKKQQLQKHLIMENNQYPIAIGRTIAFICNSSYCYEIDKNTGKKTYYICNQFYCYAMI